MTCNMPSANETILCLPYILAYHQSSLTQHIVNCLSDISSVKIIMVRVVELAVAFLYPVKEVLKRRGRDLVKRNHLVMNKVNNTTKTYKLTLKARETLVLLEQTIFLNFVDSYGKKKKTKIEYKSSLPITCMYEISDSKLDQVIMAKVPKLYMITKTWRTTE